MAEPPHRPVASTPPAPSVGDDLEIPTLATVLDPVALSKGLEPFPVFRGWGAQQGIGIKVLTWRRAERCTLDITLRAERGAFCMIGKVYAQDRQDVKEVMEELWGAGFGRKSEVSIPQPIAYVPSLRLLLQEKVEGLAARELFKFGDERQSAATAERCARWLARLQAVARPSGQAFGAEQMLGRSESGWRLVSEEGGALAVKSKELLERLKGTASSLGDIPMCACHGDFGTHNIIFAKGRMVTFDWDRHGIADPAYDVARFIVSLKQQALHTLGSVHALDGAVQAFLDAYRASGGRRVEARLPFYEAAFCLRRAERDVRVRTRNWQEWSEAMLDEGLRTLESRPGETTTPSHTTAESAGLRAPQVELDITPFGRHEPFSVRSVVGEEPHVKLGDALSGHAGPEGAKWLLAGRESQRAVRRELSSLLSPPWVLRSCWLRRARFRFRPDTKLTAYYNVVMEAPSGARSVRAIAVIWKPKWIGAALRQAAPEALEMEAEALRRGIGTPFRRLMARVPAWGMRIQLSPLDPSFPQLIRLSDPEYVRQMLESVCGPSRELAGQAYTVSSIRYYPEQRHVLRYDATQGAGGTVIAKLYNDDKGRRVVRVLTKAAEWLTGCGGGKACLLEPLAYVADDAVVLYPTVFGTPLSKRVRRPGRGLGRQLELAGQAARALQGAPPALRGLLNPHSFDAEIAEIVEASHYISVLQPPLGAVIDALIDRAREFYERLPQEPPCFTHGDLKMEHFWVTPRGLTLIDFDTSHLEDPALDIGKFLADLRFWYDTYGQSVAEQAEERFLAGYAPGVPGDRLIRARLFKALELIKTSVREVPLFRSDWVSQIERLVGGAQAIMNDLWSDLRV